MLPVGAAQLDAATALTGRLRSAGYSVVCENRDLRLGEKLTDAELLGFPVQLLLGKSWAEGRIEVRWRDTRSWDAERFSQPKAGALPQALMTETELLDWLSTLEARPF